MENNRYTNTLAEVPAIIVQVESLKEDCESENTILKGGFYLANGVFVHESKKDSCGFYAGGTLQKNGHFFPGEDRYEPFYDEAGNITAFRQIDSAVNHFTLPELDLIAQYALNSKANLMDALQECYKSADHESLREMIKHVLIKLHFMPDDQCRRFMSDVYWALRERSLRSIEQRLVPEDTASSIE